MPYKLLLILLLPVISVSLHAQSGVFKSYYSKGKIMEEVSRVEDVYDGTSYWFYENGNLKKEITYDDGVVNGWAREYYESGLMSEEFYVVDGVRDGEYRAFFDNGALKEVATYRAGMLFSKTTFDYDSLYTASVDEFTGTKKYYDQRRKKELYICTIDVCPEPIGGMDAIYANLVYPEHARLYGLQGEVMLLAHVDVKGYVTSTQILKSVGLGMDDAASEAVKKTRFLPGKDGGSKVEANVTIKINFDLNNLPGNTDKEPVSLAELTLTDDTSGTSESLSMFRNFDCEYEVCPQPEGGMNALLENLYLPPSSMKNIEKGEVIVEADVDQYGFVRSTNILKGINSGIDQSIEVAVMETRFTPAQSGGENVRAFVKIIIPVEKDKK